MKPTCEQIQHAAYERWERRGWTHGCDRDDWYAAEKELTFHLNYRTIAEYALTAPARRVLGDAPIARCRFCERTAKQVELGPPRPVVPDGDGRTSLLTAEVCEECQAEWLGALDEEFERFWDALQARAAGHGDSGATAARPVYTMAAFKSLVARAILILPETELSSLVDTMEWVANPDHDCDDHVFAGFGCLVYQAPFLAERSWTAIATRVDEDAPLPYMLFVLVHRGTMVQVPMPMCLFDEDLDGRNVRQPERVLSWGEGWSFQEAHSTALPLAVSRRRPARERMRFSLAV